MNYWAKQKLSEIDKFYYVCSFIVNYMKDAGTFNDLIPGIARGNTEAFAKFYDIYSQKVYQFSRYFIKSEETCEEVVSDVFMNIWHNREKLPGISNLNAYLYVLTRNKAYNYLDKESRIPEFTSDFPLEIVTEQSNPEEIMLTAELEKAINASIKDLPERCRIIFLMSRDGNLRYQDIAEVLSISEKTVHAQMVTALKKLNAALKKYLYILI